MKFLVAIHHPDVTDATKINDPQINHDIDALNDEMQAAGVRLLALGLHHVSTAKSLRDQDGTVVVTDGPYLETKEHIGGFWILECADMAQAVEWGRKAVLACRTPVEVRQFH